MPQPQQARSQMLTVPVGLADGISARIWRTWYDVVAGSPRATLGVLTAQASTYTMASPSYQEPVLCEDLFRRLAEQDPHELVRLLGDWSIDPTLLTFAAEHAGSIKDSALVLPALERLLNHPKVYVREGAVYGLAAYRAEGRVAAALRDAAESDPSPGVREAAREVLADA